jgi:hypothetical protein
MSRVPESHHIYHTSPLTTPDTHSTIPYSLTLTSFPAICSNKSPLLLLTAACPALLTAEFNGTLHGSKDLLLIASVTPPSIAISPNTIHSLPPSVLCCCTCLCRSFSITGSGIDWNSLEVFGGHSYSPRAHLVSFRSASLVRHSYYVPRPYWTHTLQRVATFTPQ